MAAPGSAITQQHGGNRQRSTNSVMNRSNCFFYGRLKWALWLDSSAEGNKLLINMPSVTDPPIQRNIGTPLPPLVKPLMTFMYVQSWKICLCKIIIDSSAFFFLRAALSAVLGKVLHFREYYLVSVILNTAPRPLNRARVEGNYEYLKIFMWLHKHHIYFWNPLNLSQRLKCLLII